MYNSAISYQLAIGGCIWTPASQRRMDRKGGEASLLSAINIDKLHAKNYIKNICVYIFLVYLTLMSVTF